jgi:plastocyanin
MCCKERTVKINAYKTTVLFAIAVLLIPGCASRQPQVGAVIVQGEKTIEMKASSFNFEPNNIRASQGDTIVLNVTNISGNKHNFTIKDPNGKILQSVDLLPNKTEHVKISFPEQGTYTFYCDKPLHSTMGMTGSIEVDRGN